jgi:hypothetical protein
MHWQSTQLGYLRFINATCFDIKVGHFQALQSVSNIKGIQKIASMELRSFWGYEVLLDWVTCNAWQWFIHTLVCFTQDPWPLPKPVLHTLRSSTSSLNFSYPHVSPSKTSSFLRLLPRSSVTYSLSFFYLSFINMFYKSVSTQYEYVTVPLG